MRPTHPFGETKDCLTVTTALYGTVWHGEKNGAAPMLPYNNYCPCNVVLIALVPLSTILAATSKVSVYW